MKVISEPAYVLHSKPFRDTSILLELITLNHGRVCLIAKGVRSGKSRMQSILQPFRPLLVSWSGRGELPLLTKAEESGSGASLDRKNIINGLYINELLLRFLHRHDPHRDIFTLYGRTLPALSNQDEVQQALRLYEKQLLDELGYGLILEHDVETGYPVEQDEQYCYLVEEGPVRFSRDRKGCIPVHGKSLISFARGELQDKRVLTEVKHLMRSIIQFHLGDIPVYSREVLLSQGRT